jgi:hypothetical protein
MCPVCVFPLALGSDLVPPSDIVQPSRCSAGVRSRPPPRGRAAIDVRRGALRAPQCPRHYEAGSRTANRTACCALPVPGYVPGVACALAANPLDGNHRATSSIRPRSGAGATTESAAASTLRSFRGGTKMQPSCTSPPSPNSSRDPSFIHDTTEKAQPSLAPSAASAASSLDGEDGDTASSVWSRPGPCEMR